MTTPLQLWTIWGPERWELEGAYLAMLDSSIHLVIQGFDTFESDVKDKDRDEDKAYIDLILAGLTVPACLEAAFSM